MSGLVVWTAALTRFACSRSGLVRSLHAFSAASDSARASVDVQRVWKPERAGYCGRACSFCCSSISRIASSQLSRESASSLRFIAAQELDRAVVADAPQRERDPVEHLRVARALQLFHLTRHGLRLLRGNASHDRDECRQRRNHHWVWAHYSARRSTTLIFRASTTSRDAPRSLESRPRILRAIDHRSCASWYRAKDPRFARFPYSRAPRRWSRAAGESQSL